MPFDPWLKMAFRGLRGDVLSGEAGLEVGLEAMAEYLIKAMGPRSGEIEFWHSWSESMGVMLQPKWQLGRN